MAFLLGRGLLQESIFFFPRRMIVYVISAQQTTQKPDATKAREGSKESVISITIERFSASILATKLDFQLPSVRCIAV
jgi:hypothetical protein